MDSPLAAAVAKVGDRWSLRIVEVLLDGPRRFGELQAGLDGIAPNVLSGRLKHLEAGEVVLARPYSTRPPRYAYELTASGRALAGALTLLAAWGAEHGDDSEPPHHVRCGTALDATWWCSTCSVAVVDPESDDLRYA